MTGAELERAINVFHAIGVRIGTMRRLADALRGEKIGGLDGVDLVPAQIDQVKTRINEIATEVRPAVMMLRGILPRLPADSGRSQQETELTAQRILEVTRQALFRDIDGNLVRDRVNVADDDIGWYVRKTLDKWMAEYEGIQVEFSL